MELSTLTSHCSLPDLRGSSKWSNPLADVELKSRQGTPPSVLPKALVVLMLHTCAILAKQCMNIALVRESSGISVGDMTWCTRHLRKFQEHTQPRTYGYAKGGNCFLPHVYRTTSDFLKTPRTSFFLSIVPELGPSSRIVPRSLWAAVVPVFG